MQFTNVQRSTNVALHEVVKSNDWFGNMVSVKGDTSNRIVRIRRSRKKDTSANMYCVTVLYRGITMTQFDIDANLKRVSASIFRRKFGKNQLTTRGTTFCDWYAENGDFEAMAIGHDIYYAEDLENWKSFVVIYENNVPSVIISAGDFHPGDADMSCYNRCELIENLRTRCSTKIPLTQWDGDLNHLNTDLEIISSEDIVVGTLAGKEFTTPPAGILEIVEFYRGHRSTLEEMSKKHKTRDYNKIRLLEKLNDNDNENNKVKER